MLSNQCRKLGFQLDIKNLMLDFEAGLIKAFKKATPIASIQGCRFHLGQSRWRNIGKLGLASTY